MLGYGMRDLNINRALLDKADNNRKRYWFCSLKEETKVEAYFHQISVEKLGVIPIFYDKEHLDLRRFLRRVCWNIDDLKLCNLNCYLYFVDKIV